MSNREIARAAAMVGAMIASGAGASEQARAEGYFTVECYGPDGQLKWTDGFPNTVLTAGKNELLDKALAGSSYTAAFYLGLISSSGYSAISAADTAASHAGWTESTAYSNSTRVAASWASASSGSKALSSAASFTINATDTIKGTFLATNSTKGGTSGIHISAGLFTGGDKSVTSGDTLNVSYSLGL